MKTKKFNHNEIEKCKISKQNIDTEKENYSIILDCVGDSINSIAFYKTKFLNDLINGKRKLIANELMKRQNSMVVNMLKNNPILKNIQNMFGIEQEEVVEI